jgi:DNA-directed RNA polymerase specialized sigma24 family protein
VIVRNDIPENRSEDKNPLVSKLGDICAEVGMRVGAWYRLECPEEIVTNLFIICRAKLHTFDASRSSLMTWVYGYARKLALAERRKEQRSARFSELTWEVAGREKEPLEILSEDSPAHCQDASEAALRQFLRERRPLWRHERDEFLNEAQEAAPHMKPATVEEIALRDVLIATPTSRLLVPFEVYYLDGTPKEIAQRLNTTTTAIQKQCSRFGIAVAERFDKRWTELQNLGSRS